MAREQLEVLNALDVAKTQLYHFTAIIIAGMGFFTDAYDLFSISLVAKLLGRIYYTKPGAPSPVLYPERLLLRHRRRPRRNPCWTALLRVARRQNGQEEGLRDHPYPYDRLLTRFRAFLRELTKRRPCNPLLLQILARGFGILFSGIISLAVSAGFDHRYKAPAYEDNPAASTVPQADYVWRIILMFGALPAALTFYWRMKMPETARYTALVAKNAKQAAQDMAKVLNMDLQAEEEKLERLARPRISSRKTCSLPSDGSSSKTMNAIHEVYRIAKAQTLIALCSTVPGYWFTVAFIDLMGRFAIQLMGFCFMTVFMFAVAIPYHHWTQRENRIGFVVMYALTFFFANFGPNATTFVVPAEIFPARLRSTCHGISAAAGKAGAIVGAYGFLYAAQSTDKTKTDAGYPPGIGVKNSLIVLGCVNALGILCTFAVPEAKGKSLEEASQETLDEKDDTEEV
ncbi:UNVERIFIED_CONTAM: putative inorganic phosphate transporter 1-5 [Sesamum calycinum]|uniref:Inorganic phosphate transporter 1-5 n=1 Tax=Sesamum calycinum TaxID=2727403 RepID=A0AAW2RAF3_9LAMI